MNERKIASKILYEIEHNNAYTNIAVSKAFENGDFSPEEKGFISELVHGVTERRITIDYIISQFSKLKLNKIAPNVLNAARLGIYQILYMDRIPESAAVNESVKLAKSAGGQRSAGFVNAILRNVIRNKNSISFPADEIEYLSVYYSYPQELVTLFVNEFGYDFTEDMFKAFYERRPVTLRCNTLKTTPEKLCSDLKRGNIDVSLYYSDIFPNINYAICADKLRNMEKLPSYLNGDFYVQDIAAMLVADVLNPKSGDTVIDMCAAPGGKTTHIAEKMGNNGVIYAFDIHEHKIKLINDNAKRLGIDICKATIQDSAVLNEEYIEKADCVLVDAPCSGFGIIGKKPDIKYQRQVSDISDLAGLSFKILSSAANYVKSGGTLVFSTCTVEKTENEDVVDKFIDKFGTEFYLEPIKEINKENIGYITLYPHIDGTDGFFICKFKKR